MSPVSNTPVWSRRAVIDKIPLVYFGKHSNFSRHTLQNITLIFFVIVSGLIFGMVHHGVTRVCVLHARIILAHFRISASVAVRTKSNNNGKKKKGGKIWRKIYIEI